LQRAESCRRAAWLLILGCAAGQLGAEEPQPPPAIDAAAQARIAEELEEVEHPPDQPDAAELYYRSKRVPTDGKSLAIVDRYQAASEAMLDMPRYSSRRRQRLPSLREAAGQGLAQVPDSTAKAAALGTWEPLGPGNIGGRTRAVLVDPGQPGRMYAAGVSGGIWRTTDAGGSWTPIADTAVNIAFNSMVMDPADPRVIYAGTGEGYFREIERGTALPLRGAGIFKTTDGGHFARLGSTANANFQWVNDLAVSFNDSRRVYAATRTGVWRSQDGGGSWQRILAPGVNGGCLDLALRSDRPTDVLFAACGTFAPATIYRHLAAETDAAWEAVLAESGMGRTTLALAPSDQDRIYALATSIVPGPGGRFDGGLHAFFRSDQGGAAGTWTATVRNSDPDKLATLLLSNPISAHRADCGFGPQNSYSNLGWHANVVAVDPVDPDVVFAGGVDLFRSDDGGEAWGLISYWWDSPPSAHADQHVVVFHPQYDGVSNQVLFLGSDGGVWRTGNARGAKATGPAGACSPANTGVRWTSLDHSLGTTQFYHGVPFPDGRRYLGGAQDNGSLLGSNDAGVNGWSHVFGGDGGYVAVDPTDPNVLYVETQGINVQKSVDGGASFAPATTGISDTAADALFIVPLVMDPSAPRRLWLGTRRLWRSADAAAGWQAASPALDAAGKVSAVAVDPSDSDRVLAGLSTGSIHRSQNATSADAGSSWPAVRPREGYVTWLAFDPSSSGVAYATYAGFGGQHVWKSIDGGAAWSPIGGSGAGRLPDIPVHSIVVGPTQASILYLGTDLGVFVSVDGGETWMVENTGFATVVTESLAITAGAAPRLFAFTHGRGAWRVNLTAEPAGSLELAAGVAGVFEDAGEVSIAVRRVGGSGGAVSVRYATADGTAAAGSDYAAVSGTLSWAAGDAADRSFTVPILDDLAIEGPETFAVTLSDPGGGAELGSLVSATLTIADNDVEPETCVAGATALCLRDGRFEVEVAWRDFADASGPGRAVEATPSDDSGLFWFFAPANWEMLFKVIDGCAFNDRYWVFFAATTNVEYTVTVTDTVRGQLRSYSNPLGTAAPAVTDVDAFATCP
jgi:Calx-beta domain